MILQNTFVTIKMFLYSNVSFILNSIHFHSFLAHFFLSLSKNVKDAAFLRKRRFYASFTQTCIKAVETKVLCSFFAGLHKSCMQKLRKSRRYWHLCNCCVSAAFAHQYCFYEALRKSFVKAVEKPAFLQPCVKAGFNTSLNYVYKYHFSIQYC